MTKYFEANIRGVVSGLNGYLNHSTHGGQEKALVHISEAQVLLVSQILPSSDHSIILGLSNALSGQLIPLLILAAQVPSKSKDNDDEQAVASEMSGESNEVARTIVSEEDLGALKSG